MSEQVYTPTGKPCLEDFYLGDGSRLTAAWEELERINSGPNRKKHISDADVGHQWRKDYLDEAIPASTFLTLLERYSDAAGHGLYDLLIDHREHVSPVLDLLTLKDLEVLETHPWEAVGRYATKLMARASGRMRKEMMMALAELEAKGAPILWAELRDYVAIIYDLDGKLQGCTYGLNWEDGVPIWTVDDPAGLPLARFCRKYAGKTELDPEEFIDQDPYPDFYRFDLIPELWPLAIREVCRRARPRDLILFLGDEELEATEWEVQQVLNSPAGELLRSVKRGEWAELLADEYAPVRAMAMRIYGRLQSEQPQKQSGRPRRDPALKG